MFTESACLKSNFGTYLEFLVPAVAEKSLGEVGQFGDSLGRGCHQIGSSGDPFGV
jgi:hypothetical protein